MAAKETLQREIFQRKISEMVVVEEVRECPPDSTVGDVVKILQDAHIGSVVVADPKSKKPLGIFTERDYLMKIAGRESKALKEPISRYMTPNPKSVVLSDSLIKALAFMRLGKFRHLVVVDEKDRLKSMISIKDVVDFLVNEISRPE